MEVRVGPLRQLLVQLQLGPTAQPRVVLLCHQHSHIRGESISYKAFLVKSNKKKLNELQLELNQVPRALLTSQKPEVLLRLRRAQAKLSDFFLVHDCNGAISSDAALQCPGGTSPSAEGPREPSGDVHPDPEALLGAADGPEEDRAAGLFKSLSQRIWRQPPATEKGSWRPAEAIPEEQGKLTPREARNQEEASAESGHALESVATPGTGGRRQ
ncbi:hypothetical protein NDU88_003657 [Pleurodeles waltl]|uniref:Uncharacterized protein n=1 Tax=Pleurodeles waltl TaxID=8319 RepID=A0AAV7KX42_PLEWA|nr:hypothetical protein NDU88_003657 [Pleurodeles waltl]